MSVENFLKNHPCFLHAEEFNSVCSPLKQWGIEYFSHVRIDKYQQQMTGLAQAPQFLHHYVERGYYNFDAHRLMPETKEQYLLWDLIERQGQSKEMHEDFIAHGFGHTFTLIRQSSQHIDFYNFATVFGNDSINNGYFQNLHHLKSFIAYFHDKVNSNKHLRKAYELPLQYGKGGYFSPSISIPQAPAFALDKIPIPGTNNHLTRREYQCLHWVAYGKSQEQIAEILAITPRTVKAHFSNLREKLNCYNQFQLGMVFAELQDCATLMRC